MLQGIPFPSVGYPWGNILNFLVEAHDKLGHQGTTCTYCLIKCQYYWKGMNKDIRKYIAYCTLCCREKAKVQAYPLQMTETPDRPFDKIAIDLVTECKTSNSGNKHILTIIDHLMGWPEAFPIPDTSADIIVSTLINQYLPVHMCPRYTSSDNGTEFKNNLMDQVLKQLGIKSIFQHLTILRATESWKFSINIWNQHWRSYVRRNCPTGISTWIRFLPVVEWHQTLLHQKHLSS